MRDFIKNHFDKKIEKLNAKRPAKLDSTLIQRVDKYNKSGAFSKFFTVLTSFGSIWKDVDKVGKYRKENKVIDNSVNKINKSKNNLIEKLDTYETSLCMVDEANKERYSNLEVEIKKDILTKKITFDNLNDTLDKKLGTNVKAAHLIVQDKRIYSTINYHTNLLKDALKDLKYPENKFNEYISKTQSKQPNYSKFMTRLKAENQKEFDELYTKAPYSMQDHYSKDDIYKWHADVLEINLPASSKENVSIKKSYRAKSLAYHPDKNASNNKKAAESLFKHVQAAYEFFTKNPAGIDIIKNNELTYTHRKTLESHNFLAGKSVKTEENSQTAKVSALKTGFFHQLENAPEAENTAPEVNSRPKLRS
ncbi:MAG: hypothetical protein CMF49_02615 [Legionellales bacterium]|nr:hypothetical protein [Legionellales bacterium]|tara:strand:+ start:1474 stop:2565 length:1092 start_codon:yes stop_codon:yes gene_type:complete